MRIRGRHFLITGGNRGIGWAVAQMAAREKAHVHITSRKPDPRQAEALLRLGAASAQVWRADLSTREGVSELLSSLRSAEIDILFNNAGLLTGGLLEEQPLDEIYAMLQVNVNALVHLTHGLLPGMIHRGRGKIINHSSVSAVMHFPCASTYAASKAAVMAFTNCLHLELEGTGVTTLCLVTPGIKTRMFDEIAVKYGKNIDTPSETIPPEKYAERIRKAIESDQADLQPEGSTGLGLWVARHLNPVFRAGVSRKFHR